jgi:bifunctional non-homologous end joining protein LigD
MPESEPVTIAAGIDAPRSRDAARGNGQPSPVPTGPRTYLPMLATAADAVPTGEGWLFEVKWDGYRAIARVDGGRATLSSRRGQHLTERFAAVAGALPGAVGGRDCVLDGEVCALDANGRPSFSLLQQGRAALAYFAFDLLELDRRELLDLPLAERRERLAALLAPGDVVRLSEAFDDGAALLEVALAQGLEGVVAKRPHSRYRPGTRSRHWLKVKARRREELPVAGWVRGDGARERLGSLVLARPGGDGRLVYAGNVGSGFDERSIDAALAALRPLARETTPLARVPVDPRLRAPRVVWTEPRLLADVEFTEWTHDGHVRAPVFRGLRAAARDELVVGRGARSVRLTRLDRPLFREDGITRGEVVDYYRAVAPVLLPHLRGRPFTIKRYYTVVEGPCAWEKDAPAERPEWLRTCPLPAKSRGGEPVDYTVVDDELALLWLLEYGAVDLHVWTARCDRPDRPDYVLFDLDPRANGSFADAAAAALVLRDALELLGVESLARTTGGDGLHVHVPIARRHAHEEARRFARVVSEAVARTHPQLFSRVGVDVKMNGHGQQIVSAYSVRPVAGAPVATPLAWDEVSPSLDPRAFTMAAVLERVDRLGDLAEPLLRGRQRLDRALASLA